MEIGRMSANQYVNLNLDHFPRIVQEKIGYWLWRRRYDEIRHEYFTNYRAICYKYMSIKGIFHYLRKRSYGCLHSWSAYEINGWCQFCDYSMSDDGQKIHNFTYNNRYNWRSLHELFWAPTNRIHIQNRIYNWVDVPKRYWYSSGLNRTDGFGYKEEYDEYRKESVSVKILFRSLRRNGILVKIMGVIMGVFDWVNRFINSSILV